MVEVNIYAKRTKISEKRKFHDSTPCDGPKWDDDREGRRRFWIRVRKLLYTSCANGKFTACAPVAVAIIHNIIRSSGRAKLVWRFYLFLKEFWSVSAFALVFLRFLALQSVVIRCHRSSVDENVLNFDFSLQHYIKWFVVVQELCSY